MSPLGRALLACACAALLRVACAVVFPGLDNALYENYEGFCTSHKKGDKSRIAITARTAEVPPGQWRYDFNITDTCLENRLELVGGVMTACDENVAPVLNLGDEIVSPGEMHRAGSWNSTAHFFIKLYCI